jgi:single-strand DNA-binding protein
MSVNKVILMGNVGKDPEYKDFDNDGSVAKFTLATTDRAFKTANGTEVPERTEWHNIVLQNGLAKIAKEYVKKGNKLYIEGKIRTRSYEDNNGVKRYVTEVYGYNMEMLSPNKDGQTTQQGGAPTPPPPIPDQDEDDLPF